MSRIDKSRETDSRLMVGWGGGGRVTANGFPSGDDGNVVKLIVVMMAHCEYTKNHRIVHFK